MLALRKFRESGDRHLEVRSIRREVAVSKKYNEQDTNLGDDEGRDD